MRPSVELPWSIRELVLPEVARALSSHRWNKRAAQVFFLMSAREIRATGHKEPVGGRDMPGHHDVLSRR